MKKKFEPESKVIPLRVNNRTYKELRKLSYLTERHMADLIRDGIEMKIEENKKVLTNSQITV